MKDEHKTKKELINELEQMRRRITNFETSEIGRSQTEEALNVVYEALNSSVNGVIITNTEGLIIYTNPAFLRMFGYRKKPEILGRNAADLFLAEDVRKFADVEAIIDKTKGETEEFIAQHQDGTKFLVEVSSSNVTDTEGNIIGRMASFVDITERIRAKTELQESEKQVRMLSSKLIEAEERERNLIARDLHDVIGSRLTAIKYALEQEPDEPGKSPTPEAVSLGKIVSMVQETIKETKRIYRSLRPPILDDLGILATITWFSRQFQEVYSDIVIETRLEIQEDEVPEYLKIVIYRTLQEALNNVAKHSGAGLVRLSLTKTDGNLVLSIEDDGRGFDLMEVTSEEAQTTGLGLSSMKERVELFGGSFQILAAEEEGTRIEASWAYR
ncbi:MAG: PAS domain S-box protein [Desulfobacteraceae bacterium]|jgi:PAS domain S-box-containing protein